jgi:hypothetical protein
MAVRAQRNHVLGVVRPTISHTMKMVTLKIRTLCRGKRRRLVTALAMAFGTRQRIATNGFGPVVGNSHSSLWLDGANSLRERRISKLSQRITLQPICIARVVERPRLPHRRGRRRRIHIEMKHQGLTQLAIPVRPLFLVVTNTVRLPDIADVTTARVFEEVQCLTILTMVGNGKIAAGQRHVPDLPRSSIEKDALFELVRVTVPTAGLGNEQEDIGRVLWCGDTALLLPAIHFLDLRTAVILLSHFKHCASPSQLTTWTPGPEPERRRLLLITDHNGYALLVAVSQRGAWLSDRRGGRKLTGRAKATARQSGGTGGDQAPEGSEAAEITRRPSLTSTCRDVPTSKPASASQ